MRTIILVLISGFAFGQTQTIFIAGNNKAANDLQKEMTKQFQKGKSCLEPISDPNVSDLRMEVNQDAPGSGYWSNGYPAVSAIITDRKGAVVFRGDSKLAPNSIFYRTRKALCPKHAE